MYNTVESDETDAPLLAVLMVGTTVLTVLTILATIALFYWQKDAIRDQYADSSTSPGRALVEDQRTNLNNSVWIDKAANRFSMPIDAAKELIIKESR